MLKHLTLIYTHLKWVLCFILYKPFSMIHDQPPINIGAELSKFHYEFTSASEGHVECAVCLRKIAEGDEENREMTCGQVFHKGCLNNGLGLRNATCPRCRGSVFPTGHVTSSGAEVLFFEFCSVKKGGLGRERWWLR